jgi:hypothetical protein
MWPRRPHLTMAVTDAELWRVSGSKRKETVCVCLRSDCSCVPGTRERITRQSVPLNCTAATKAYKSHNVSQFCSLLTPQRSRKNISQFQSSPCFMRWRPAVFQRSLQSKPNLLSLLHTFLISSVCNIIYFEIAGNKNCLQL